METTPVRSDYRYADAAPTWSHHYVLPRVEQVLAEQGDPGGRTLDFGCGNGAMVAWLTSKGYRTVGIDPSESGIAAAKAAFPELEFHRASSAQELGFLGQFDIVTCIEVIEHCYDPRSVVRQIYGLLRPGGLAILSTPYHGYLKNVALALSGKMDAHFTALWDGGHIKFFSPRTMTALLREAGFHEPRIHRVGRIPPLAKSMIAAASR